MLPGKAYTPEDILRILWHRKWLLIVPFVVASVCTYFVARRLPSIYRSHALIQLVSQRIPEQYVPSTVTERIDERLKAIQQVVLSRSRLEQVIKDFNLYPEERRAGTVPMEDTVDRMRARDIQVNVERGDAFRINFYSGDPRTAQKVAEKLASLFIDENAVDVLRQSTQTNQFLDSALEDHKRRLMESEKKLEDYKRSHSGELPSQMQANMQAAQSTQMQLLSLSEAINRDRDRRNTLERQVAELESSPSIPVSVMVPSSNGDGSNTTVVQSTAVELEQATKLLAALQVRFKPDYPDVVATKRRIRDLEAKLQAETASRASASSSEPVKAVAPGDILRQNRIRDLKNEIALVTQQIDQKLQVERGLQRAIANYQANIAAVPTRETELVELQRDYGTIQTLYLELLRKRENAQIAHNVAEQQIGEQFKLLDPARLPEKAHSPDRQKINLMGAALGLAIGVGLIGLLEYRDTSFKTEEDVVRILEIPVLALVPMMASEREMRAMRRRKMLVALAVVVMVVSSATAVLIWKLQAS